MFEYFTQAFLCTSDGSQQAQRTRYERPVVGCFGNSGGASCYGNDRRSTRPRPAEVISSQGPPTTARPPTAPWEQDKGFRRGSQNAGRSRQQARSSSPIGLHRRSLVGDGTSSSSFTTTKGGSFAMTSAALDEKAPSGLGLNFSMQQGLGLKSQAGDQSQLASHRRLKAPEEFMPQGPGPLMTAANYEAVLQDRIDRIMQELARGLPVNGARMLRIRRLARGDYEVDGTRITVGLRGTEAYVYRPGAGGTVDDQLLSRFLVQAADAALGRSIAAHPISGALTQREATTHFPFGAHLAGPYQGSVAPQGCGYPGGGVLAGGSEAGSFIIGGSFYSSAGDMAVASGTSVPQFAQQPQHGAALQPKVLSRPASAYGSFYGVRPDQSPLPPAPRQLAPGTGVIRFSTGMSSTSAISLRN
eukprot:TRINITY_DN17922_c0_g1_i1.p1 TRINITY_DN17922_c0_g1~~TRINITY_DN17922_c0_g1_i1.p1  ORF type:complete len:415 (+),score=61.49 TRINITY_DN17922_c0_g1_i1:91-1335(+)